MGGLCAKLRLMPRLDLLVARNKPMSRREVTRAFRAGRVRALDGTALAAKTNVPPSDLPTEVLFDHAPLTLRCRYDLILHKPLGVVTAHEDRRHPTAYALLQDAPLYSELRAVGRLDKETSGLLMWTTDGTLLHRITHPRYAVPRTYHVALATEPQERPETLTLHDGYTPEILELTRRDPASLHPALDRPADAEAFASITITAGRFHEVRRIFAALGSHVVGLARVRFGDIELPTTLDSGQHCPCDLKAAFSGIHPRPL